MMTMKSYDDLKIIAETRRWSFEWLDKVRGELFQKHKPFIRQRVEELISDIHDATVQLTTPQWLQDGHLLLDRVIEEMAINHTVKIIRSVCPHGRWVFDELTHHTEFSCELGEPKGGFCSDCGATKKDILQDRGQFKKTTDLSKLFAEDAGY